MMARKLDDPFLREISGPATKLDLPFQIVLTEGDEPLIGSDGEGSEGNSVDGCVFRDNFEAGDSCYWSTSAGGPACL